MGIKQWKDRVTGATAARERNAAYQRDNTAIAESNRAGEKRLNGVLEKIRDGKPVDAEDMDFAEQHGGNAVARAQAARERNSGGHSR